MSLPAWRYDCEDRHGLLTAGQTWRETTLFECRQLGRYDAHWRLPPHGLDRFGEDRDGRAFHAAYEGGYGEGEG